MDILTEGITAAALCIAVMTIIWAVRGKLLVPRRCRSKIFAVVELRNGEEEMEQLCRWLEWVRSGGADIEVILISDGLSPEDERRARLLSDRTEGEILSGREFAQMIGERLWQEKTTT